MAIAGESFICNPPDIVVVVCSLCILVEQYWKILVDTVAMVLLERCSEVLSEENISTSFDAVFPAVISDLLEQLFEIRTLWNNVLLPVIRHRLRPGSGVVVYCPRAIV